METTTYRVHAAKGYDSNDPMPIEAREVFASAEEAEAFAQNWMRKTTPGNWTSGSVTLIRVYPSGRERELVWWGGSTGAWMLEGDRRCRASKAA